MRFNVVIRRELRAEEVPTVVGLVLEVESDTPHAAAERADAWMKECRALPIIPEQVLPPGAPLQMELFDATVRGKPGG